MHKSISKAELFPCGHIKQFVHTLRIAKSTTDSTEFITL